MSKAFIGLGAKTTHGGIVVESEPSLLMNGIAVHLTGMKHYCPKCQSMVIAIASDSSITVKGRAVVIAGDQTSCGAIFLPMQHLTVAQK
ncbi:MAG: PAAR domain-containing protein [Acinetobacter sp.]